MKLLTTSILVLFLTNATLAQHLGFGAKGGLLVGTQKNKRALISYHADVFFESMGKWQGEALKRRIGYVIQAGYHRRGASYNNGLFGSNNNFSIILNILLTIIISVTPSYVHTPKCCLLYHYYFIWLTSWIKCLKQAVFWNETYSWNMYLNWFIKNIYSPFIVWEYPIQSDITNRWQISIHNMIILNISVQFLPLTSFLSYSVLSVIV